jgi:hypothetical protein
MLEIQKAGIGRLNDFSPLPSDTPMLAEPQRVEERALLIPFVKHLQ